MEQGVNCYEVLGVLPGADPRKIRREYQARSGLLRPEMIAGAPSNVLRAVTRAQGLLDNAWQVLSDPASRRRYDHEAGLLTSEGGLDPARNEGPSELNPDDMGFFAGELFGDLIGGWQELFGGGVRRPRRRGPTTQVPDVRGLFSSTCRDVAHRHGLEITIVRLTERPMAVEGLVVSQDPAPGARCRGGRLTVQVWHPPARNPS
jgi:curved DNA-binding protein CbpA